MPIDLSRERDDDQPIPAGVYKLRAAVVPGGFGDDDVLKLTRRGTLAYLNLKNTVAEGEFAGFRIWDMINVEVVPTGLDDPDSEQQEKDQKTAKWGRNRVKRIVASARAVDPGAADAETLQKALTINSWGDLHGMIYWAQVEIEPAQNGYRAKNKVERIITPADADWPGSPGQPKLPTRRIAKPARNEFDDDIPF
jgi:hypothetical protein